jgi:hypothetical protein
MMKVAALIPTANNNDTATSLAANLARPSADPLAPLCAVFLEYVQTG